MIWYLTIQELFVDDWESVKSEKFATKLKFSEKMELEIFYSINSQRSMMETKGWDVFRVQPPEDTTGSLANQKVVEMTVKFFKVVAYLLTFVIVLSAGVISKGLVLFMTSQVKYPLRTQEYCSRSKWHYSLTLVFDRLTATVRLNAESGVTSTSQISDEERVSWMWALFFSFVIPEFFMWFRASRICFFRQWKRPPFVDFLIILIFETFHVVGVALLVYAVLPNMKVCYWIVENMAYKIIHLFIYK